MVTIAEEEGKPKRDEKEEKKLRKIKEGAYNAFIRSHPGDALPREEIDREVELIVDKYDHFRAANNRNFRSRLTELRMQLEGHSWTG